ncbi:MAG TPA: endoglucanase, partial [Nevskiaceae bacterium]|nr:endoglucanase [Nevskiaceae bacterium]
NRNDLRCGDGWNQEDLSIFSRDQQDAPDDDGGRAVEGFCRPYVQRAQGVIERVHWSEHERVFSAALQLDPAIPGETEVFLPRRLGNAFELRVTGTADCRHVPGEQRVYLSARSAGNVAIEIRCKG